MSRIVHRVDSELTLDNFSEYLPDDLAELLPLRDGAARLVEKLPEVYPAKSIADRADKQKPQAVRLWELVGLYYRNRNRVYDAIPIFRALYLQMLRYQRENNTRCHKGMPLVWISDCYQRLRYPVLTKRYLMLTLIEDAISSKGIVSPEETGVYFRLVWGHGLADTALAEYALQAYDHFNSSVCDAMYPEWVLQEFDSKWMVEYPAPQEGAIYDVNPLYAKHLISSLGDKTGKTLERLAEYILSCMPGCRTMRRAKTKSTDYDIVCSMEGFEVDFRSEFGRYFLCECKDWDKPADYTTMAKLCRVLDSVKCRFGILFSSDGVSGANETTDAEREQLKIFQDRGMVIVVIDRDDLEEVADGKNLMSMLRSKYEEVRLDIKPKHQ